MPAGPAIRSRPTRNGYLERAGACDVDAAGRCHAWIVSRTSGVPGRRSTGVARGRSGSTRCWPTASPRRTSIGGCSRRACCAATVAPATSRSRTARWSASAGEPVTLVNHGRLGPKGLFGSWQGMASRDRLTRPLIRANGELVECDWDTAMNRIVDAQPKLLAERGPLSHGFYTSGQLFLEEYYALAVHRQGRNRHPAHGRQHPAVHGHGGGGHEGDLRLPTGSPARTRTSMAATPCSSSATTWPRPRRCCGRGFWTGSPARTGRSWCASTRGTRKSRASRTCTWPSAPAPTSR